MDEDAETGLFRLVRAPTKLIFVRHVAGHLTIAREVLMPWRARANPPK